MTQDTTTRDFTTTTTTIIKQEEQDDLVAAAAEDSTDAPSEEDSSPWHTFGTVCPKEKIVFLCQVLILYTVILINIYNLTTGLENSNPSTALMSTSLGYLLPNPTLSGEWEGGLAEIQYPHSWYNVREGDTWFYLNECNSVGLTPSTKIEAGYYHSPNVLFDHVNKALKRM